MTRTVLPVVGGNLRKLLRWVFVLFILLAVNSLYLGAITLIETLTGSDYQDYFYLLMFLLHLLLGLLLVPLFILFGLLHQSRARLRPNRYAVRAGFILFTTGLLLLLSGIVLTRFGFLEINDPQWRTVAYWTHVGTPLLALWLFVVHRMAGRPVNWGIGKRWGVVVLMFSLALTLLQIQGGDLRVRPDAEATPYLPALVRLAGQSSQIPARHLMEDGFCAECHTEIASQSAMSMHRLSSFNNPAYRFSIDATRTALLGRDGNLDAARLCAVCHDQVPLFSGRFDDPDYAPELDPGGHAGITCIGCHSITAINSPLGNGAYAFEDPPRYPFALSDNGLLQAFNHQLIKAKPAFHKRTFLKRVHRSALFCSGCHKVHLPYELNHYRWLRGQDHYDSFLLSGVSGHRVDSFYYPERAVPNCAYCHMPLTPSSDPAARSTGSGGAPSIHDHTFATANTGVPYLLQQTSPADEMRRNFLRRAARVDIFGIREFGELDGQLHAPLGPRQLPALVPGKRYLIELVVRTQRIGHQLTQGTADSNELWLDISVHSGDRLIGRSGALGADGGVDPWSYFLNSYLLDRDGGRIERRDAQNIFVALYDHQIPPGAAATIHYTLEVPAGVTGPIAIDAALKYRKFDTRFVRHVQGVDFQSNDLPVAVLAEARVVLPLAGGFDQIEMSEGQVDDWERWNDYGIGLLRKGKRELRQAEAAFSQVESLEPAHGALNLARVFYLEGRLDEAAAALARAADAHAPAWTLAWYSALVEREFGNLDAAIELLQALAETRFNEAQQRGFDFSQDHRLLVQLGRTLFERARQERDESRRRQYLQHARERLLQALQIDPENAAAHHNMALVLQELKESEASERHRLLHEKYRSDDLAVEQAVSRHRRLNPAANHAAEETAVYDLQRVGAIGLDPPSRIVAHDTGE
ncbi:MAG: aspartate phosphatase [Gammaproteobacteria bacterium]|nr:aspartate phosphatase [Gammaproteobacteria bacterium]